MEVESGARKMLLADATVNGYVVGKGFKYRLETKIEGTGGLAFVVSRDGGWATPDSVQTSEYPLLWLRCYADPSRDALGEISEADAADKAFALFRVCDRLLHGKRGVLWGGPNGLRVHSSQRWSEPFPVTQDDMHGRGAGGGEVLGDTMFVTCSYALHVTH